MGAGKDRLDLTIDVLELPAQQACALWTLSPQELIAATLQEFREIEQLGIDPADYDLFDVQRGVALEEKPLSECFSKDAQGVHLRLVEKTPALPRGAQRAPAPIYLREQATGRVYRVHWLPAIIGRPDRNLPDNHLLAVNLEALPTGLRVSRRHLKLSEASGQYFVERLSGNPTMVRRTTGESVNLLDASRVPLEPGDVIVLERSQIVLKFLVPPTAAAAPQAHPAQDDGAATADREDAASS